ncbi:cysteine--tRNA ligase [Candidatus Aerophobetes bacterium]|uniref:Cysteine--tRNA ligase n=1 Tax=Aerophobetes bacterium TaxID=2030807 RepID=A0A2A4X0B8_UNCAE|nr:MAG: cysteine--tRNA ligase [Candidatus Aerophobetes bacterium]
MRIFNTETREKETLTSTRKNSLIKMYTCGPTVYNRAHLGNFRTYVFEDLLRRVLKQAGFKVEQAMNLTDVDDKTIRGAREKGQDLDTYTEPFKKAFFKDLEILEIEKVEHYPEATHYISQMIEMIEILVEKDLAYKGQDGNVFFRIASFPRYGRLSGLDLSTLRQGGSQRVDSDEYDKESVSDFVLWKAYDASRDGDIFWKSPWGKGRPGWHIECSAMAKALLGEEIDIHVGGVDNIFPHHENEIAQSEGCSGRCFARFWMHSEHLIVEGKKMSKSLGNFYRLEDLLDEGFTGREIRFLLLSTHYRLQLNFSKASLFAARASLERIDDFIYRLLHVHSDSGIDIREHITHAEKGFFNALFDDLNIAEALRALFGLIKQVNKIADRKKLSKEMAGQVLTLLREVNQVLSVLNFDETNSIPEEVLHFFKEREEARLNKEWKKADDLRGKIAQRGYEIEDRAEGARLKKKA